MLVQRDHFDFDGKVAGLSAQKLCISRKYFINHRGRKAFPQKAKNIPPCLQWFPVINGPPYALLKAGFAESLLLVCVQIGYEKRYLIMPAKPYHFIVVDDEQDVRSLIRDVFSQHHPSAKIFEAANGQAALELFNTHGADLMIIDHHIPLLDGLSLVRYLRAQNVKIPLVMISNNPQIEKVAPGAGATCFLNKLRLYESLEEFLPAWLAEQPQSPRA
jgi:CheY-like chemotaxis protein